MNSEKWSGVAGGQEGRRREAAEAQPGKGCVEGGGREGAVGGFGVDFE